MSEPNKRDERLLEDFASALDGRPALHARRMEIVAAYRAKIQAECARDPRASETEAAWDSAEYNARRAEKAERERDERVKELEEHLAFYRDEPVCDFAKLLARRLYYDINDVPSIETVGEWTDAVSAAIDAAVVERLRSLPDRIRNEAFSYCARTPGYEHTGPSPAMVIDHLTDWLRREVER